MLKKQTILRIKNVYTANAFWSGNGFYVGAGSETEPVVRLYDLTSRDTEELTDCPGGMMGFIPVPGNMGCYVTIMGLFPPFLGQEAGLFLHQKGPRGWKTIRVLDLPFAHRCEFIQYNDQTFLVAATVSRHKENPADWSNPGEIHVIRWGEPVTGNWKSQVIDSGITRNHGMTRTVIEGTESVCISGAEGIFAIRPSGEKQWELVPVFEKEVSEMTFIDLDGDGNTELVTVEPFHGHTINVYKRVGGRWRLKFSDSLSFGHGLSSGMLNGNPVIVAGNRSGSLALETFTVNNLDKGLIKRKVIELDVGPTQTQVFSFGGQDYIMSANQRKNEVALYNGSIMD
jgi:hypothetical protein